MLNTSSFTQGVYPFMIEIDALRGDTFWPSHTHGLYDLGFPEFIMDPLAFGKGNATRINSAFDYLIDPENSGQLDAILNGQIIKLTGKKLSPIYLKDDPYTYCLREVPPEFEAVKLAYGYGVAYAIPRMQFIQIWVAGDDFVLLDNYYRNGVKW